MGMQVIEVLTRFDSSDKTTVRHVRETYIPAAKEEIKSLERIRKDVAQAGWDVVPDIQKISAAIANAKSEIALNWG